MNRSIDRAKLFFFGLFLIVAAGMWGYQAYYVWPKQSCEADGRWWSPEFRQCATPIPIEKFTGRLPTKVVNPAPGAVAPQEATTAVLPTAADVKAADAAAGIAPATAPAGKP